MSGFRVLLDCPAYLIAIHAGHHDIEQNQINACPIQELKGVSTIGCTEDGVDPIQGLPDYRQIDWFIINNEDRKLIYHSGYFARWADSSD